MILESNLFNHKEVLNYSVLHILLEEHIINYVTTFVIRPFKNKINV